MTGKRMRPWVAMLLVLFLTGLSACGPMASDHNGIEVLFDGNPRIYKENVYYQGVVVGQIVNQTAGKGMVYKMTVQLAPEYQKAAGKHWVFYADNGGLNVSRISPAGQPLNNGDKICGFGSKAALNWFKLKTLLTDRVYKANRIADELARRFG